MGPAFFTLGVSTVRVGARVCFPSHLWLTIIQMFHQVFKEQLWTDFDEDEAQHSREQKTPTNQ